MRSFPSLLLANVLAATLASLGCHAQVPAGAVATVGQPLPQPIARRVEVLLRQKAQLPPDSSIAVATPTASELPGYVSIGVTFTTEGKSSKPVSFLLSADGKTLAQFNKFDISADPKNLVSGAGRPFRGGPESAPVLIVVFDDLECPFCARMHQSLFPAVQQRYGDKVHVVYQDLPLTEIHPWAQRAAIDVNCLAAQSTTGYWNLVDYIHAHASEIGTDPKDAKAEKSLANATTQLDKLTRDQGAFQKVDAPKLDACIAKQDTTYTDAVKKVATTLSVDATPALFINGDKIEGAVPIEFIFSIIDDALRAENVTPPPPYVAPAPPAPATAASTPAKPGR
jgi:protein-disulfide isomerase